MNQKFIYFLLLVITAGTFAACDDFETYAEQKDKERAAISSFIAKNNIKVISEEQFLKQDTMTDVSKNEYVLFGTTGVYMQIIERGEGEVLKSGETATVLSRFTELNILTDSIQLSNNMFSYGYLEDKYDVSNLSGTFYASFDRNQSLIFNRYGSASVPSGWLLPLTYVKLGRPYSAHVKIIVPHDQGHSSASSSVYPCLYDITYLRGR